MVYFSVFILLLAWDQLSKAWVLHASGSDFILKHLSQNTGIAFGLIQGSALKIGFLNLFLLALILIFRQRIFGEGRIARLSLAFICAGGIGNCIDRLRLGYVIDFLTWFHIPNFNFADVFINLGIALFLLSLIQSKKA